MNRSAQLQAFAERDPSNLPLQCDLLDAWLQEGRAAEAAAHIDALPEALRVADAVRFRAARCALVQQDFAQAQAMLGELARQGTGGVAVRHDLAFAHLGQGDIDGALASLEGVDLSAPEHLVTTLLKARALFHKQRIGEALEILAAHRGDGTHTAELLGLRALLLLDAGDADAAGRDANDALAIDAGQHEALLVQGTLALWHRQLDASTHIFQQVLGRFPESGRALLGLGLSLMPQGDIPAARAFLDRAVVAMPTHPGTWHALAWCQLLEGDLAGAKHSFEQALTADRTFGESHGGLALVHALRSERAAAEDALKRALRLSPQSQAGRYAQSVLLLDDGKVDEARAVVEAVAASTPDLPVQITADFIYRLREALRPRG